MRSSRYYRIRGITLFVFSGLALFFFPIMSVITDNLKLGEGIGMGLFASVLFFIVGWINYHIYLEDNQRIKEKDERIRSLEKELKKKNIFED